ncbi:hypothetical protein INS49_014512 [Diaporthe citri]|uniref:uncharacterized protein n=1 Tax=Diaporthe citri TaxID=83186 RepID=UPI001C80912F|nr:uncharacterized protein INS49_014512 [Diaporthe citri]KAG6356638.1 hypothetical protein INS49_014512 [Diaporthe citri]
MGRAQGDHDEEAVPLTSAEWLTGRPRIQSEKPSRLQWSRIQWSRIQWSRMAWSMVPWVIAAPLGKTERTLPKVTSTSYLNGLRGVACVVVYNYHVTIGWYPDLKGTLGLVPFANFVLAGHGATMIFFVLSGFVLAYSPLSKMSSPAGTSDAVDSALLTSLWSSTIRRGFRLFTPLVGLALLLSVITFFSPIHGNAPGLEWAQASPKTLGTYLHHLYSYSQMVSYLMDPFTWSIIQPSSLEHAWTLPFEYRGSLVVFLLCVACARLTPRCRKVFLVAFALWALHWIRWDVFCFTAGMFLAELRFRPLFPSSSSSSSSGPKPEPLPHSTTADNLTPRRPWDRFIQSFPLRPAIGLLALGPSVIVCAWPDGGGVLGVEPYATLHVAFTPGHYGGVDVDFLYASVGAVAVLASLEALPPLQWLLSTAPFRYLGEISFSFYLLHILLINTTSAHIIFFLTQMCGWGYGFAFALMWVVTASGTVLAADLFWRGVDETSVRMSRKISDWLIAKPRDAEIAYHAL